MRTAPRTLALCFGLALALAASAAESPVWIVLGSYQSVGNAEAARREPGMDVMEPLQVRAFDTAAGRRHRLLLGPFETRGQATAKLAEVRSDGHAGAWLLVGDGGDAQTGAAASDLAYDPAIADEAGDDELEDWERFDPYGDLGDLEELPPLPESNVHLLSEQPKRPVSEPPPGYQLHKLRRSASRP